MPDKETIIKNLKESIIPAIKLINEQRWKVIDLEKSICLHKSRENNLLKKIEELQDELKTK